MSGDESLIELAGDEGDNEEETIPSLIEGIKRGVEEIKGALEGLL